MNPLMTINTTKEFSNMKILFVLTSHDTLGNTGEKTGFWVEEFASPYYLLADKDVEITLASPKGGMPPIDPKSNLPDFQTKDTHRFNEDISLRDKLSNTLALSSINALDYDAIFYPGGHGPLWDLVDNQDSIQLIEAFINNNKPVAAVCHASATLLNASTTKGQPIVQGREVTGFSNSEEAAVGLSQIVPVLVEDALKAKGAKYVKASDWSSFAVQDGLLITGQNPASSAAVAELLFQQL